MHCTKLLHRQSCIAPNVALRCQAAVHARPPLSTEGLQMQASCAVTGDGLTEGLEWVAQRCRPSGA